MGTKRREQTVRLAELLGIDLEPGEATSELLERCIAEVEANASERHASELVDAEAMDRADAEERQRERAPRGLHLLGGSILGEEQPEAFRLEPTQAKPRRRKGGRKAA